MSVAPARDIGARAQRPARLRAERVLGVGLVVFAAYHLALGLLMVVAPHAFYLRVGPFGPENHHYIGDNATYALALGVALGGAARWSSWRVPVLVLATLQFALHTLNHLKDIDQAHPHYQGPVDFGLLALGTMALGALLGAARRQERGGRPTGRDAE